MCLVVEPLARSLAQKSLSADSQRFRRLAKGQLDNADDGSEKDKTRSKNQKWNIVFDNVGNSSER